MAKREGVTVYVGQKAARVKCWLDGTKEPVRLSLGGADFEVKHEDTPEATLRALAKAVNEHPGVKKIATAKVRPATTEKPLVIEITAETAGAEGNKIPARATGALHDEGFGTLVRGSDEWFYVAAVAWDGKGVTERVLADTPSSAQALQLATMELKNRFGRRL